MKNLFALFTLILFVNQMNGQLASGSFTSGSTTLTPGTNIASVALISASNTAKDCTLADDNARSVTTTDMTTIVLEITPNPGYAITTISDIYVNLKLGGGDCAVGQSLEGKVRPKIDGVQSAPDQFSAMASCSNPRSIQVARPHQPAAH